MIRHGVEAGSTAGEEEQLNKILEVLAMPETIDKHYLMVISNPDNYRSWNILKERILSISKDEIPAESSKQLLLTQKALESNPKSYHAWYHRTWLIKNCGTNMEREYRLCCLLLSLDPRNFHCWNHSRRIGIQLPLNFDNYSSMQGKPVKAVSAFYCDPSDEGIWRYFGRSRLSNFPGPRVDISKDKAKLYFPESFRGRVELEGIAVDIPSYVLVSLIDINECEDMIGRSKLTLKVFTGDDLKNPKIYNLVPEESVIPEKDFEFFGDNLVFICLERLRITPEISKREELVKKLCLLDPMRESYYRSMRNRYFKSFRPWQ